ncbi:carboxylesterase/lipase family protein [Aldersonia sp. NBC_00410]|uniref:carboxylesterase/lipase family protein n=1 Tax=Aldersonia sp. NBC_00410 TaxID=2975954 RepID=UPI002257850E|nr:carboxylesterase/lipase family protein [Aldersonia sp. NBC_00410]MCX5044860.1 carboxylesterase/lipase family protein [Aldersonia sp. NBC_00410]
MTDTMRAPIVRTRTGQLAGRTSDGITSFLGIPYAAPPFGANRMCPPQPVQPWDGVREAVEFGPTAPKGDYPPMYQPLFAEVTIPGEDCLNLNVWTPDTGSARLPVLVWIHGGSFMNGSGSVDMYNGSAFARDGVVCVTINYRLGAEGFLYLGDGIANLGLLDQVAALRWVQDNIAAFGGDPTRVTVAGESAGAMSITTLLAMPLADGLFAQAITQSGAGANTLTEEQGRMVGGYLADALGVPASRDALREVPLDRLVQTASDLVTEVQTGVDPVKWGSLALSLLPFAPTVDGTVLPAVPLDAFAAGAGAGVPLLVGCTRDEARLFLVAPGAIDFIDDDGLAASAGVYGLGANEVAVYQGNRPDAGAGDVLAAVVSDWFFRIPALRVAEARGGAPTWVYRFDALDPADNQLLGSCHATEVPFVFGTHAFDSALPLVGANPSPGISAAAHGAWVSFATTGNPGWSAYDTERRATGLLTDTVTVTEVDDPAGDERALWDGIR